MNSQLLKYKNLPVSLLVIRISVIAVADDLLPTTSYLKPDVNLSKYTKLLIGHGYR